MQAAEMITAPKIAILAALLAASPIVAECGEWNTSRDVIAAKATDRYKSAIEKCLSRSDMFPACLKEQFRTETITLEAVYKSSLEQLQSSPDEIVTLRASQEAWTQFQQANCTFARSVAPTRAGDRVFQDCLLRSTSERIAELSSLVGD